VRQRPRQSQCAVVGANHDRYTGRRDGCHGTVQIRDLLVDIRNNSRDIVQPHEHRFPVLRIVLIHERKQPVLDPINGGLTQIDLNKLFLGPDFLVAHRYAQNLADFFICFIFSAGMPILPFISVKIRRAITPK